MKGFFAGALVFSPITAIIMWVATGYMSTVDTKVERGVTASQLADKEAKSEFDMRWQEMGGNSASDCVSHDSERVAAMRSRLAELEQQLTEHRAADAAKAASIDDIVGSKE